MSRCNSVISDDSRNNSFLDRFKGKISQMPKKGIQEVIKKNSPYVDKTIPSITKVSTDAERSMNHKQFINYDIPSFDAHQIPLNLLSGPNTPSSQMEGRYIKVTSIMEDGRIPSPIYSHETTCKPHNMYVMNANKPPVYGPNFEQNDIKNTKGVHFEKQNNTQNYNTKKATNQALPNILQKTQKIKRKNDTEKFNEEKQINVIINTMIESPMNKKKHLMNDKQKNNRFQNIKALNPSYYAQRNSKPINNNINYMKEEPKDLAINDKTQRNNHSPEFQIHNNDYSPTNPTRNNDYSQASPPPNFRKNMIGSNQEANQYHNYNKGNYYQEKQNELNRFNNDIDQNHNNLSLSLERRNQYSKSPDNNRVRAGNVLNMKNSHLFNSYEKNNRQGDFIESQRYNISSANKGHIVNSPDMHSRKVNSRRNPERNNRGNIVNNSVVVDRNVNNSSGAVGNHPLVGSRGNLSKSFDVNEYKFAQGSNAINNGTNLNNINHGNLNKNLFDNYQYNNRENNQIQKTYGVNYQLRNKSKKKINFGAIAKNSIKR